MKTERNRAAVLALALRASTHRLAIELEGYPMLMRQALAIQNALASVDTVAEELEAVAAGRDLPNLPASPPDPAGPNLDEVPR